MKKAMILLEDITCKQIEAFSSAPAIASNKALLNYHTRLSSLWTRAMREHMVQHHAVRNVTSTNYEQAE